MDIKKLQIELRDQFIACTTYEQLKDLWEKQAGSYVSHINDLMKRRQRFDQESQEYNAMLHHILILIALARPWFKVYLMLSPDSLSGTYDNLELFYQEHAVERPMAGKSVFEKAMRYFKMKNR